MHSITDSNAPGEKYFFTQLAQIYEIETKEVRETGLYIRRAG